jgi:hypothetical protein
MKPLYNYYMLIKIFKKFKIIEDSRVFVNQLYLFIFSTRNLNMFKIINSLENTHSLHANITNILVKNIFQHKINLDSWHYFTFP